MLQIERGVPLPSSRTKYPFFDMEVGDSLFLQAKNEAESARQSALRFVRVHRPDWRFSMRRVRTGGWRLWRTA